MEQKKGQISVEYLIIVGFIVFIVLGFLGAAFFYSSQMKDTIRFHNVENFAAKIISSAEGVYYRGEPSRITITAYLPAGVNQIDVSGKEILFNVSSSSGPSRISYSSSVELEGVISPQEGVKRIQLIATTDRVNIISG